MFARSSPSEPAPGVRRHGLLVLVVVTVSLAVISLLGLPSSNLREHGLVFALLAIMAGLSGGRPVRIPALRTEVTATDAFIFCGLAYLGPRDAALVAIAGILGAALGRPVLPTPLRLAFNLGNVVLSTTGAWAGFRLAGGQPGTDLRTLMLPLALATALYFLTNTFLVAAAIALERGQPLLAAWRRSGLWTAVASFSGLTLSAGLLMVVASVGPWGLALGIPPCWILSAFYRSHKDRLEQQELRIETVEERNTELERRVNDRTRDLQSALATLARTNERLRKTNQNLEDANQAKSGFLAKVSHELRTPLNAIIGFSELLGDPEFGDSPERRAEFLADISASGEHLLSLINNLLDLSKIEAGKMELHVEVTRIPDVLLELAAMVGPLARKKRLEIRVECDPEVAAARVDPGMFREVLTNLLSNAVKFTERGSIVVSAQAEPERSLVVAVEDTGIGVASADHDRIFREFYQVDGSFSRKYEGTGLGLALVRRLVELHGGTVVLDSELGAGCRFTCRFPSALVDPPVTVARAGEPPPAPPAEGKRILLVEDNPLNAKLVRNLLRSRGYEVVEAGSAEQALVLLGQLAAPALILMDIELPGLDGLALTRQLKADPVTARIPIVAVSAHAHAQDEERARAAGCVGYIRKPIRLNRLPAEIESHCRAPVPAGCAG